MQVTINGEIQKYDEPLAVDALIRKMGLSPDGVAVEINLAIIPAQAHMTTWLTEGDMIEIVHFIGGG